MTCHVSSAFNRVVVLMAAISAAAGMIPQPPPTCKCEISDARVCGANGQTYSNACLAQCAGVRVLDNMKGCDATSFGCACIAEVKPVCGIDGQTYSNLGCLLCDGAVLACRSECPCDSECPKEYAPVCGSDGITYGNECFAKDAGVDMECAGECPCPVCSCSQDFNPICGDDSERYNNPCLAACSGAKPGPCS